MEQDNYRSLFIYSSYTLYIVMTSIISCETNLNTMIMLLYPGGNLSFDDQGSQEIIDVYIDLKPP
jgi:hypothetical protein